MHFVMHLFENVLVIHILVERNVRAEKSGTVILTDSLTQRQTIEVGRENTTSRQKDWGSITSVCLSHKTPWRHEMFYPRRESY